jgi:hypothetical protein
MNRESTKPKNEYAYEELGDYETANQDYDNADRIEDMRSRQ